MPRRAKLLVALLLLPLCAGVGRAVLEIASRLEFNEMVMAPLLAGVLCMGLLYFWLPKPIWVYVLGHEFTHAIATVLCGGRVKGMKVGSEGGHVYVTRDNFFVALAPYFIPIYAIMVFVIFALGRQILDWESTAVWAAFFWALGLSYSFHILLTWNILHTRQTDITSQGYVFSAVIIFLGNALVVVLGMNIVSSDIGLGLIAHSLGNEVSETYLIIGGFAENTLTTINSVLNSTSG
jgi:hypothetical protein